MVVISHQVNGRKMTKKVQTNKKKISADEMQTEDEIDNLDTKGRPTERSENFGEVKPQPSPLGNNNKDQSPSLERDDSM